jgi:hypothetical protein
MSILKDAGQPVGESLNGGLATKRLATARGGLPLRGNRARG